MLIQRFREATRQLHEEIEEENSAAKIIDHSISLEEYRLLLLQNYIAYKITEEQISRFLPLEGILKHQRLKEDLSSLNVDTSVSSYYQDNFTCNTYAEALGAAYVVEGSALGGMVIAKELKQCENLNGLEKQSFFNGDRNNIKSWNTFKKELDKTNFSEEEAMAATEKAKETFRFFKKVFTLSHQEVELIK